MHTKLKKNGGWREERYAWEMAPMSEKTPNRDPKGHWARVEAHLTQVNPADRQGRLKARKMQARVGN